MPSQMVSDEAMMAGEQLPPFPVAERLGALGRAHDIREQDGRQDPTAPGSAQHHLTQPSGWSRI
jgi:hypothetical protein